MNNKAETTTAIHDSCGDAGAARGAGRAAPHPFAGGWTIQGGRGAVVGWGFTISNPDPDFLVVTSAEFCQTVVVAGFTVCDQLPSPALGTFTDYIAQFNFIVAGPAPESPVVSQAFNRTLLTGVGSFAIAPGAPYGTFSGQILLTYDLYSRSPNDPLFDAGADLLPPGPNGNTLTANAAVSSIPNRRRPADCCRCSGAPVPAAKRRLIASRPESDCAAGGPAARLRAAHRFAPDSCSFMKSGPSTRHIPPLPRSRRDTRPAPRS